MSCKIRQKDCCLNSSATVGSDNSLTPLTSELAKLEFLRKIMFGHTSKLQIGNSLIFCPKTLVNSGNSRNFAKLNIKHYIYE